MYPCYFNLLEFLHKKQEKIEEGVSDVTMHREEYQNFYGALSGDKIQLGAWILVRTHGFIFRLLPPLDWLMFADQ